MRVWYIVCNMESCFSVMQKKRSQLVFQLTTVCDLVNVWHLNILPNTAVISVSCAGGKWRDVTEDDSMYVTRRECSRLNLRMDVFYLKKKS